MPPDGVAANFRANAEYFTQKWAEAEERASVLASRVAFWRTVAIVALSWLAGAVWVIGTR
jgi:hypothetical protein